MTKLPKFSTMNEVVTSDFAKTKEKLDRESINIIRTLQRNNVQLIHIADNKAAVLLSLNAIILTLLLLFGETPRL